MQIAKHGSEGRTDINWHKEICIFFFCAQYIPDSPAFIEKVIIGNSADNRYNTPLFYRPY